MQAGKLQCAKHPQHLNHQLQTRSCRVSQEGISPTETNSNQNVTPILEYTCLHMVTFLINAQTQMLL